MTCLAKQMEKTAENVPIRMLETLPLWQLDIGELTGHNLEVRGRPEVNRPLQTGWCLLHIYTLKYEEDGVWRERPMAILGKLRDPALELEATRPADKEVKIHAVKTECGK